MNYTPMRAKVLLESLTVYRGLLQDEVISALRLVLHGLTNSHTNPTKFISDYSAFYHKLIEYNPMGSLGEYLIEKIAYDDNVFSRYSDKTNYDGIRKNIRQATIRDLASLETIANLTADGIKKQARDGLDRGRYEWDVITDLPEWETDGEFNDGLPRLFQPGSSPEINAKLLADFHKEKGTGEFAKYIGFVWERGGTAGHLKGVRRTDPIRFTDLISYERERKRVVTNTLQFLNGYPANNVLLYGDRGTGKSSTVKALLNEYSHRGLRVIELPKTHLGDLHDVLRQIEDRGQKFIIFVDDLSFDDDEREYTALKAVLEGSLECKPSNVVIYATSNRRHLIKERFSDRAGLLSGNRDDEVHAGDTMQEKLSLADRFGITVTFTLPNQKEYLEIVEGLVKNRGFDVDTEALHAEALRWEMYYNGRSPRTARQFVDWLEGQGGIKS
ncbi:MAG TPA: ATP-binding protein [Clostridia bacterium]|nr:ATP-binding protein [Clostridia bacterium]